MGWQAPLDAQSRSAISSTSLDAAIATPASGPRATVNAALSSESAVAAAAQLGLTADDVADRVAALDDASVAELSEQILAGGHSTLVISTTTIIIVLLILILLTD
jgi:phosphoribosylcarboxyaminoimidazole (NCAIR) mutase